MIPSNLKKQALDIAKKSGFLTQSIWREMLSPGGLRYKQMGWLELKRSGLFVSHPSAQAKETVVLNPRFATVNSPSAATIDHDEDVMRIVLCLEKAKLISTWKMEAELKKQGSMDFAIKSKATRAKYPDAIFELDVPKKTLRLALEVERNRKSMKRYREIMEAYSDLKSVDGVLFICATKDIENVIRGAMKAVLYPAQKRPLGFGALDAWTKNAAAADLILNDKRTSLHVLRDKIISKRGTEDEVQVAL